MRLRVRDLVIGFGMAAFSLHAEMFKMENKVIKSKISYQHLNRLSVKGDKIDSVLGIEKAFHIEKNEKTGEAFIRPTEENGYTPISLSVTTMSGKTQDLLLEPVEGEANSIELVAGTDSIPADSLVDLPQEESSGSDYEETVSAVMKRFINLPPNYPAAEVRNVTNRVHQHIEAKFESGYLLDGFLCLRFKVSTDRAGTFILDERMFSKVGDISLSLSTLSIGKGGRATLYVLRKSS